MRLEVGASALRGRLFRSSSVRSSGPYRVGRRRLSRRPFQDATILEPRPGRRGRRISYPDRKAATGSSTNQASATEASRTKRVPPTLLDQVLALRPRCGLALFRIRSILSKAIPGRLGTRGQNRSTVSRTCDWPSTLRPLYVELIARESFRLASNSPHRRRGMQAASRHLQRRSPDGPRSRQFAQQNPFVERAREILTRTSPSHPAPSPDGCCR